jgi:hypothetical protein
MNPSNTYASRRISAGLLAFFLFDCVVSAQEVRKTPAATEEPLVLSPFEVTESNRGYYAANTMSGTRLNTKLEDLASSISVITKQQMADFALLDINDIFNYEAGTEGTGNFTDYTVDRNGQVSDNIQSNPQGANRIRGLGSANISVDNFSTSGRVPIDPINIDAVEINRGPNSNIFGLGGGSGTVNLVAASANLFAAKSMADFRLDNLGGYRTSLDLNRPLLRGQLAVRGSIVVQHDAYRLKPSGTDSRRYNLMVRAQPWRNTSIRLSYQHYELEGVRTNTVTPRDAVTYWRSVGSPAWDPTTNSVTVNGLTSTVASTGVPVGLALAGGAPNGQIYVADGGVRLWTIRAMPAANANNGPNNVSGSNLLRESAPPPVRTNAPLFATVPGVTDRSLYDYTSINLAGINTIFERNDTVSASVEQWLVNQPRHKLALQLGANRESSGRFFNNPVGVAPSGGNSNYLNVDVNAKLLDGTANPFFGRPYIGSNEPVHQSNPYLRETVRGQLAYVLDLTAERKWYARLGRHQLLAYGEQRLTKTQQFRWRDVNIRDNPIYAPAGQPKGNQTGIVGPLSTRAYFRYYVGDKQGQNVDYSPSPFAYGDYTFRWYNPQTSQWVNDPATLAEGAIQEGAGNTTQNLIKTRGVVTQHTLLDDRLIVTWGKRHDQNNNKSGLPAVLKANGYEYDYPSMDGWRGDWAMREGDTTTSGLVARPFRGWGQVERLARQPNLAGTFGRVLSGIGVYYNKSDSFQPSSPALGVTLDTLPDPTSRGKDYGFTLNLWEGRLVVRANRFETRQINTRNAIAGTYGTRILRMDLQNFLGNNDAFSLQRQARNWVRFGNPALTDQQVETEVYRIMQMSPEAAATYNRFTIADTQDALSRGNEIEINLNPDRFWTVKFNATRLLSTDVAVAPRLTVFLNERLPVWETIIDPRTGNKWLDQAYSGDSPVSSGTSSPRVFLVGQVTSQITLAQAIEGKNRNQVREWRFNSSGSLRLARFFPDQRFLKNVTLGGSVRWESEATIGYYGIPQNGNMAAATAYDPNRPISDRPHTYLDAFASYNTRLFRDKVRARFQLNLRNIQEWKTHLEAIGAFPDGSPHTFRIKEPMTAIFSTSFEL